MEASGGKTALGALKDAVYPYPLRLWKAGNRFNFLREMSYVHGLLTSPAPVRVLEIETTTRCPSKCISCPKSYKFGRGEAEMPLALFESIAGQLSPGAQMTAVSALHLTHYGDVSMYPHFAEAVRLCKGRGLYVTASTNAALLMPPLARKVVAAGLDEIWMVLDGMDDETSMKIRGVSAGRGISNVHSLLAVRKEACAWHMQVKVVMIRQPANRHQWDAFVEYWGGVEGVSAQLAYFSAFDAGVPEINRIKEELDALGLQDEEEARLREVSGFRCYYPWHSVCVQSDGLVVPCCRDMNGELVLGDTKKKTLAEIWNDRPIRELRREMKGGRPANPLCSRCREANSETGLPNRYYPGFDLIRRLSPRAFRASGR